MPAPRRPPPLLQASTPAYRTAFGAAPGGSGGALASPALTATPGYRTAFGPPPLPSPSAPAAGHAGHAGHAIGSGLGGFGGPGYGSGSGAPGSAPGYGPGLSGSGGAGGAAAHYSLFSGGAGLGAGAGGPLFQQEAPLSGGSSMFASAFEPSPYAAATPLAAAGAPVHRAASEQEDALLSACGFPSYGAFAQQVSLFL